MTDGRPHRPTNDEREEFDRRLDALIVWALGQLKKDHGEEAARAVAEQLDRQQFRLMTNVETSAQMANRSPIRCPTASRWPSPATGAAGRGPLVRAGGFRGRRADEAGWTGLQHGLGVPDDASELTDPPST